MACWTWNKKSSITWVIWVLKLLPRYFKSTTVSNDDTNYGIIGPRDQPKCLPTRACIQISQGFSATKTKASGVLQGYSAASNNWGLTTNTQALVCTPHKKLTSCWLFHPAPPNAHCLLSPTVTLCVHVPIGYDIFCAFVCKPEISSHVFSQIQLATDSKELCSCIHSTTIFTSMIGCCIYQHLKLRLISLHSNLGFSWNDKQIWPWLGENQYAKQTEKKRAK
jgi:hypothetical protein